MLRRQERVAIAAVVVIYGVFDVASTILVLETGSGYETNPFAIMLMDHFGLVAGLVATKVVAIPLLVLLFIGHARLLDRFESYLGEYRRVILAARYTVPAYAIVTGFQLTVRNLGNLHLPL